MPLPTVVQIAHLPVDELPPQVMVPRLERAFEVTIRPPGSKSITNRALLLAALARGESVLRGALVDAEDAQVMIRALEQLGAKVAIERTEEERASGNATLRVSGVDGRWKPRERNPVLNLQNAGTATRFLTAAAILSDPAMGPVTIDGNARMRERPIGELVELLWAMGVDVRDGGRPGFLPISIHVPETLTDLQPRLGVAPTQSSQFVSALMLIAGFLPRGLHLLLRKPITSEPYLRMSESLLRRVGFSIRSASRGEIESIRIPALGVDAAKLPEDGTVESYLASMPGSLRGFELKIEPDMSGASYFAAAGAMVPGSAVTLECPSESLQGDAAFFGYLRAVGATVAASGELQKIRGEKVRPIDTSFAGMPDVSMTAAVVACFAEGQPSVLRGLKTLRVKETDRLAALQTELTKLGARVEIETTRDDEALRITPPVDLVSSPVCRGGEPAVVEFDTYDDHRMAMSLALIGLRRGNVVINDPACVRKTYPTYWRDLARLYGA